MTASVVTGIYIDPGAGRVTFDAYYRTWSAATLADLVLGPAEDSVRTAKTN